MLPSSPAGATWAGQIRFTLEAAHEDTFETKACLGRGSLEDADHLYLLQRGLNDSGRMPGGSDLECRDTPGERLPPGGANQNDGGRAQETGEFGYAR